jgi:hypothetical protein
MLKARIYGLKEVKVPHSRRCPNKNILYEFVYYDTRVDGRGDSYEYAMKARYCPYCGVKLKRN